MEELKFLRACSRVKDKCSRRLTDRSRLRWQWCGCNSGPFLWRKNWSGRWRYQQPSSLVTSSRLLPKERTWIQFAEIGQVSFTGWLGSALKDRVRRSDVQEVLRVIPRLRWEEQIEVGICVGCLLDLSLERSFRLAQLGGDTGADPGLPGDILSIGWPGKRLGILLDELVEVTGRGVSGLPCLDFFPLRPL